MLEISAISVIEVTPKAHCFHRQGFRVSKHRIVFCWPSVVISVADHTQRAQSLLFSHERLVSVVRQLRLSLIINLRSLLSLRELFPSCLLPLVICSALNFSSLLQSVAFVSSLLWFVATLSVRHAASRCCAYRATTSWYFHPTS